MNLRPHHLLCIQKFTGHGYDAAFTDHMTSIVSELSGGGKAQILLTQGCDDLCRACPNNRGGSCTSLEKVAMMDSSVLDVCGLACGESAPWAELASRARERILETQEFNRICNCCQWFELCKNTEVAHE